MDEHAVLQANDHVGLACHGGVYGVAGERVAHHRVDGRGRHAADVIAGIDVANDDGEAELCEVVHNLVLQEKADVAVL